MIFNLRFFFQNRLKEKQEESKPEVISSTAVIEKTKAGDGQVALAKKTMWQKVVDECKHYYSGFKLLFLNVRVSSAIVWKILNGHQLTRRESKQVGKNSGIKMPFFNI